MKLLISLTYWLYLNGYRFPWFIWKRIYNPPRFLIKYYLDNFENDEYDRDYLTTLAEDYVYRGEVIGERQRITLAKFMRVVRSQMRRR